MSDHATRMQALAARLVGWLETGDLPPGLFSDDVFCDFTPPQWRLQARGLPDMLALRRRGHPAPGHVPRWHAEPTPSGFVMEVEERWTDAQGDWYCREAMLAEVRGDAIARLSVYCTGDWNAERQAAHRAQVALLEP